MERVSSLAGDPARDGETADAPAQATFDFAGAAAAPMASPPPRPARSRIRARPARPTPAAAPIPPLPAPLPIVEEPVAVTEVAPREAFGAWLLAQRDRKGWIAELAKAAKTDRDFPKSGNPDDVHKHFQKLGADGDAFEALDDAELAWTSA